MSKIVSKKEYIELPNVPELVDLKNIRVYYVKEPGEIVDSEGRSIDGTAYVDIPYVTGQLEYLVNLPGAVPVTEGTYKLGTCGVDAAGNESDVDIISDFFDFTAPPKPTWKR